MLIPACVRGCRGNLILDCRDFNNSGVEQCFTAGTSEPQPCKPPASNTKYPALTEALSSGSVIDGNEGSLCVLNPGHRLAPGIKSPFIPASAGGGGCNLGLNCLSLRVRAETESLAKLESIAGLLQEDCSLHDCL